MGGAVQEQGWLFDDGRVVQVGRRWIGDHAGQVQDGIFRRAGGSVVDPVRWVKGVGAVTAGVYLPAVVVDLLVAVPADGDHILKLGGPAL